MRQTHSFAVALAAVLSTALAATASARSLLYYYDFDMVDASGNLVVTGVNKGTGSLEPSVVNKSGNAGASYNSDDGKTVNIKKSKGLMIFVR